MFAGNSYSAAISDDHNAFTWGRNKQVEQVKEGKRERERVVSEC